MFFECTDMEYLKKTYKWRKLSCERSVRMGKERKSNNADAGRMWWIG